MKITVLVENAAGAAGLKNEHGLSLLVDTGARKVLMDFGASNAALENADELGVDLGAVDAAFLSHGHYDHSGSIPGFYARNQKAPIYLQKPALEAHWSREEYIGMDAAIAQIPTLHLLEGSARIDDELEVFSGIPGRRFWPGGNKVMTKGARGQETPDDFAHEQCLVIRGNVTVLISGCAHNGIVNIVDRYRELYGAYPDVVVSGFHMMKDAEYDEADVELIEESARELLATGALYYTGHCTSLPAFDLMKPIMGDRLQPLHTGLMFEV